MRPLKKDLVLCALKAFERLSALLQLVAMTCPCSEKHKHIQKTYTKKHVFFTLPYLANLVFSAYIT